LVELEEIVEFFFLGSLTGTLVVAFAFFYVGGDGFGAGQRVIFVIDSLVWCFKTGTQRVVEETLRA
jgi:hypothetical protein